MVGTDGPPSGPAQSDKFTGKVLGPATPREPEAVPAERDRMPGLRATRGGSGRTEIAEEGSTPARPRAGKGLLRSRAHQPDQETAGEDLTGCSKSGMVGVTWSHMTTSTCRMGAPLIFIFQVPMSDRPLKFGRSAVIVLVVAMMSSATAAVIRGEGLQVACPGGTWSAGTDTLTCPGLTPPMFYGGFEDIPPPPPACAPPEELIRRGPATFAEAFGSAWPGADVGDEEIPVGPSRYIALQFNSGPAGVVGNLQWEASNLGGGAKVLSFSTCEGDFRPALESTWCLISGSGAGSMTWRTTETAPAGQCRLEPATTYYLNVVFASSVDDLSDSTCGQSCGVLLQNSVLQN